MDSHPTGSVVSRIHSGLGNQLFQYAMGRAVAIRSNARLVLDVRSFDRPGPPYFGIDHFNIRRVRDDTAIPPGRREHRLRHFVWNALKLSPRRVQERSFGFDPEMLSLGTNVYLDGYWQSERYFDDVGAAIREDLRFAEGPGGDNATHFDAINRGPAISLHVRRGDYLLPRYQARFGNCSLGYYRRAVEFIAVRANIDPVVYVFSDDPAWARDNLALKFETRVIACNGPQDAHEDMRLMSACRHHVIANSTFSWWGAWLNPEPDKIVVAPTPWFVNSRHDADRVPATWHRLPSQDPDAPNPLA